MAKGTYQSGAKSASKAISARASQSILVPIQLPLQPRFNFINNLIVWEAWQLPALGRAALAKYIVKGVLELTIQNFDAKRLQRAIREKAYSPILDDAILPGSSNYSDKEHVQPQSPAYGAPTRWDMNGGALIDHNPLPNGKPAPKQRVLIKIINVDGLIDFYQDANVPVVTAKDEESSKVLVNLTVDPPKAGPRTARFWLLYEGGNTPPVMAGFNIALLVTDRENSTYSTPIIVDPKVPNRG